MASNHKCSLRSTSLPSRSHPTSLRIEEELNKLKKSTSESSIWVRLSGIEELNKDVIDFLNLSSAQELLFHFRNEKSLNELLDGSVRVLDICGITRDALLQFKEQIQALQSAFRRRKGDSSVAICIENYVSLRKKMNKDAKKFISALKQMETRIQESFSFKDQDCYLVQLLKEVVLMNSLIFQSVLNFLSPSKPKTRSRWSMIAGKLMHRGAVACEDEEETHETEIQRADAVLINERFEFGKIQIAQERLKELDMSIQEIEKCLGGVFRHLIKTRASLLNIISQ